MSSVTHPTAKRRSPWWVVVGGGTANAVGPQMYLATIGPFVLPIVEETGFSRTTVTGAYSVAAVGMAIGLVIVAQLVDGYAARYILVPGGRIAGAERHRREQRHPRLIRQATRPGP
ncbi:hypothetical protein [Actinopolymorpha alba]|uniref:hypothetical protein n=1 Tax=Actinopolymorpha alba TaxID=533267 RepID=UPI00192CB12B|nr:hypothetical protein [Actinopolymorpha alba]